VSFPNGGFDDDGNFVINPKSRPLATIYGSFSDDELGFLTTAEQAVVRNRPSGYPLAALAQAVWAARETPGPLEAIQADLAAYAAEQDALPTEAPPQNSPTDFVRN
jgi:hypothetical protein